jgi:hypothetical protein
MTCGLLLNGFRVDPSRGGERIEQLAFLSHGPVAVELRSKLTFLIGENAETMARAGRIPMPTTGEWRLVDEQSRGEGVLSLLTVRVDASEGLLYLMDEPETELSPQRQMALLCLLDELHRDDRSQALVATHSPNLMSHPGSDRLWIDEDGITRRSLVDIPHWRDMNWFMRDPDTALHRLLD